MPGGSLSGKGIAEADGDRPEKTAPAPLGVSRGRTDAGGGVHRWNRPPVDRAPRIEIPGWKKWGDGSHLGFAFHSLRHTANSIMLSLKIAPHVVATQLGHKAFKGTSMTWHYAEVFERELIDVAETVAEAVFPRSAKAAGGA